MLTHLEKKKASKKCALLKKTNLKKKITSKKKTTSKKKKTVHIELANYKLVSS